MSARLWEKLPVRLWLAALVWLVLGVATMAQDRVQLQATNEDGFGRLVFEFSDRMDLPPYKISFDNNVLAITFDQPVSMAIPDMSVTLPNYTTIGRVDPGGRGVRFGLRSSATIHSMEAGEKLFVDLLPVGWQGLPPSLPPAVVAELTQRAKDAAAIAEQKRKADEAKALNPKATIQIGRNPTFYRVEVDWSVDTKATYKQDGTTAGITFDWPVPIDLYALKADLPSEIQSTANAVTAAGSSVTFTLADGVTPRFYAVDGKHFTFDIDLNAGEIDANRTTAEAVAKKADVAAVAAAATKIASSAVDPTADDVMASDYVSVGAITPVVDEVSGTVRIAFPFERDTASAVFRRGDTLWMLFDTKRSINQPATSEALSSIASAFTVSSAGDTQLVRIDLSTTKLASLASAGRSWVLSIGDVLLNATEPVVMTRNRDQDGHFEMSAMLGKPFKVHSFRDPTVGDVLDIVTSFPPARGTVRDLSYVDFDSLRSVQGLVLRPENDDLQVTVADDHALIRAPAGLFLSDQNGPRMLDAGNGTELRDSYVDFASLKQDDPAIFAKHSEELSSDAAMKEGQARDVARLALAQYYVGNQFAQEAIGVLKVVDSDLKSDELKKKVMLTTAIANVLASRPKDALAILNNPAFGDEVDALMWRTIARANDYDFVGARADALAADSVLDAYPTWVKQKFLFAAIRAAVETSDATTAQRYLKLIAFAQLSPEDLTLYQLFQARVAEMLGQTQEALDTYGQVITADVRPTRAEAVYRTLLLLRQTGKIDPAKATVTLAAESMLWRGNPLEVDMEKLLAELYFANKEYRQGFETAKDAAANNPESKPINDLVAETQTQFTDLFLNGAADQLGDLDALSLYYDFPRSHAGGIEG